MSYKIRLSTEETYLLADKMNEIQDKKRSRRLLALSLRHFGYPVKDIALIVGASEKTVTEWMKSFLAGGFDGLLQMHYPKRRGSKLAPYETAIRDFRQKNPEATLEDVQQWLKQEKGLEVEYSWLYRYLERHDL
jgi:transposase